MNRHELVDRYHRHLNYLRISITDRCNLQCMYCGPNPPIQKLQHDEILRYEEIIRIVNVGVRMGIRKIRVTGGEPLVRKGVIRFLQTLTDMEELEDVSLTTNAVLLKDFAEPIRDAGIRRINISLDTLEPDRYRQITGRDAYDRVWDSLMTVHRLGFDPIKINVVAMRGINDDEFKDLAALTFSYPFHVRFIEYMPIGDSSKEQRISILIPEIRERLADLGKLVPAGHQAHDGPAERFQIAGARGEIGFIGAMSHHFCDRCNRLRLTAAGNLRPCLLSDDHIRIRDILRNGGSDDDIENAFLEAVRNKPHRHGFAQGKKTLIKSQMCAIGG